MRSMLRRAVIALLLGFVLTAVALGGPMSFTVSFDGASRHLVHVIFRCEGLKGETQDFKMPAWTPGYYRILDHAKNVANFRAEDGAGKALAWEKVTANTWRVVTSDARVVTVSYDVNAAVSFVANSYVNESRAFLSPPGLYMHVAGHITTPVTVTLRPPPGWSRIATGLDSVAGKQNTFSAPDFDVLYDCPLLMGDQETLRFEVRGVPHVIAMENVAPAVDRPKMLADLKRVVEATVRLMGDLPYRHYVFLMMGRGNGGIEHANSAAISFNGNSLGTEAGYLGWLSYVAHEYFHCFNVKRIRPIALGPFDYDRENLTRMLWVSEGLSVYYQDLLLVRAGLITRERYLEKMQGAITRFEDMPGRRYQSAADSSLRTWGTSGVGGDRNTTISYYDNGGMLGAMLDLGIRSASGNRKSLDDVMRALYRRYSIEKKRGFTDAEFRAECEAASGAPLDEVFEYASTTRDYDYARYFGLAGVAVESSSPPTGKRAFSVRLVPDPSPAQAAILAHWLRRDP